MTKRKRASSSNKRRQSTVALDMSDGDVLGVVLKSARVASADSGKRGVSPTIRLAAMTMGTLTAAKLLLRVQRAGDDDFQPAVWERLEQRSDDLASEHFDELTAGYEGVVGRRASP